MSNQVATLPTHSELGRLVEMVVFDFDGVFTDNTVWTDDAGNELVRCWRSDGLGLAKLRALGIPSYVLSTETHPVVTKRCEKLRIPCRQGLAAKEAELEVVVREAGVAMEHVVYVGNDINDLGCLRRVGIPIVVDDAHADVLGVARFRTRTAGGFGAVREVCDWISASRMETRS